VRILGVVLAIGLILAVLWFAGEQHRENCIHEGRSGCSILPWENGHSSPPAGVDWKNAR
jgi:hypothetical protein